MHDHGKQRLVYFQATAKQAIEQQDGAAALETIVRAYGADIAALQARVEGAEKSTAEAMAARRTGDDMLGSLHAVAAAEILRNARLEAHVNQLRSIVDRVREVTKRARVEGADDAPATVPAADLEALLARPVDQPKHSPTIVAFTPSQQYRHGQFATHDRAVTAVHAFTGWSIVVRQGNAEPRRLEPTFLVDDRSVTESFMWDIYALRLEKLT